MPDAFWPIHYPICPSVYKLAGIALRLYLALGTV